jgi:hypothetical protein
MQIAQLVLHEMVIRVGNTLLYLSPPFISFLHEKLDALCLGYELSLSLPFFLVLHLTCFFVA